MIDSRRKFLRNAAGLLVPAAGLLTPPFAKAANIVINGPVVHAAPGAGWKQGIAFRDTLGYVTDGADDWAQLLAGGVNYPTATTQGNNVGWTVVPVDNPRDRNAGIDVRLAGCNFAVTSLRKYRIDLPSAGDYLIRCAAGDASNASTNQIDVYDNVTLLSTIVNGTAASGSFRDATNVELTAANWPGSNASVTLTFASTICIFEFPSTAINEIAYLYIEAA